MDINHLLQWQQIPKLIFNAFNHTAKADLNPVYIGS